MSSAVLDDIGATPASPRPGVFSALSEEISRVAAEVARSVVLVRNGRGAGSGVIWQPDGLILTNYHVVPVDRAEVILPDGRRFAARATARDPEADLTALQVESPDLPAARPGDSRALRPGEIVIAVGNPLGLRNSVTAGIISGTGELPGPRGGRREMIWADLDLYPGNSGGALADVHGRVVGLPAMVLGPGRAVSVPAHVIERFLAATDAPRSWFGFQGAVIPLARLPAFAGEEYGAGLLLLGVLPDSPAERAGFLPGDIVLGRAGQGPLPEAALQRELASFVPGEEARLAVLRGGQPAEIGVTPEVWKG